MRITKDRPIAIYYEHPEWFRPLFGELDRRALPYEAVEAASHRYDPERTPDYALVLNRMSPSAYLRGHGAAIGYTHAFLAHLERSGVRVVNGRRAFETETSKALQLSILRELGLPHPRARVIGDPRQAPAAAEGLRYPVVVKPNVGGSGAGIVKFDDADALRRAAAAGTLDLGPDGTALVQEYIEPEAGHIVRVEMLGGSLLYAIRVHTTGETFDLCPADICRSADGRALAGACATDRGLRVEGYEPPAQVVDDVARIMDAAGIEVGGVEYVVSARDGRRYYYDINALSNFVADATRVVGFDPFPRLVDYLEREAA